MAATFWDCTQWNEGIGGGNGTARTDDGPSPRPLGSFSISIPGSRRLNSLARTAGASGAPRDVSSAPRSYVIDRTNVSDRDRQRVSCDGRPRVSRSVSRGRLPSAILRPERSDRRAARLPGLVLWTVAFDRRGDGRRRILGLRGLVRLDDRRRHLLHQVLERRPLLVHSDSRERRRWQRTAGAA